MMTAVRAVLARGAVWAGMCGLVAYLPTLVP
jgi:hypothetical protein